MLYSKWARLKYVSTVTVMFPNIRIQRMVYVVLEHGTQFFLHFDHVLSVFSSKLLARTEFDLKFQEFTDIRLYFR